MFGGLIMLLFGHPYVSSLPFYHIDSIEAVRHTPPNSVVTLFFTPENLDVIEYLRKNNVRFALHIETPTDAVLGENLGASYLIASPKNDLVASFRSLTSDGQLSSSAPTANMF